MEFLFSIVAIVIVVFVFFSLKNSFDDEETKLFRKIWSSKRMSNEASWEQERKSHAALKQLFGVNLSTADSMREDAVLSLFQAADKFDVKYPNNLGTVMLDEIEREISSSARTAASPPEREAVETKLSEIKRLAAKLIGMRKTASMMGISVSELNKGMWDEATEDERTAWKEKHPNLSGSELFEKFTREKLRNSDL
jgi:hypothetical protein